MCLIEATKARWRRTEFIWGQSDCILSVCDYVAALTGVDPAAPWRGSYGDAAGARAICAAHGGVLGLFRHGMARAGFAEAGRARGRPVVVDMAGHEIAGIDLGRRVLMRMDGRGVVEWPAEVLGAWECG